MDPGSVAAMRCFVGGVTTIFIVVFSITALCWLLAQYLKHRGAQRTAPQDAALVAQLTRIADRMDQRMEAVERILDADSPSWRGNGEMGGRYEHIG